MIQQSAVMQASTSPVKLSIMFLLGFLILVTAADASGGSPMSCSQMCHYLELGKDAYCGGRNLSEVPQCCSDSELLDLRQNNLRSLEGHPFHEFHNLRFLDLSDNYLEELPQMSFEGAIHLQDVYLMNNQFTIIERDAFTGSERIQSIYISNNWISGIQHSAFKQLPELRVLYLSQNELPYVSRHQFQYNTRLTHINLAHNRIEILHVSTFKNLPDLEFLDLSYNKLHILDPSIFGTLPNLRDLRLTNNSLTSEVISDSLLNAPSLEELDIRNNNVKTIPRNLNEFHLKKLRLGNNPLTCDCSFKSLQELYLTKQDEEWVQEVNCISGERLTSVSLECEEKEGTTKFNPTEALNTEENHFSAVITPFILTTGIITLICTVICVFIIYYWIKTCLKERPPKYMPYKKSEVCDVKKGEHIYIVKV